jgi:MFS family permease
MKMKLQVLHQIYHWLLGFYPRDYREEYGDELQAVLRLKMDDALKKGKLDAANEVLYELLSFPGAIIYQHLRERSTQMSGTFASRFDFTPGTRNETLAAMAPFVLFGVLPLFLSVLDRFIVIPLWLQITLRLFLVLSVLSLFVIGFVKGVPRWSFPYLGLPLPVASILLLDLLPEFPALFHKLYAISWFYGAFVFGGLTLMGVFLSLFLLVLLTGVIPKFYSFHLRLREDWTLLCFLLYGTVPFSLLILLDEYRNEEPYLMLAFLALAAGAWLYLQNEHQWKKFLSLFGGMTLSMIFTMVGQAILYEIAFPTTSFSSWSMTLSTVIYWIWLSLFMFLSRALTLLPGAHKRARTTV